MFVAGVVVLTGSSDPDRPIGSSVVESLVFLWEFLFSGKKAAAAFSTLLFSASSLRKTVFKHDIVFPVFDEVSPFSLLCSSCQTLRLTLPDEPL